MAKKRVTVKVLSEFNEHFPKDAHRVLDLDDAKVMANGGHVEIVREATKEDEAAQVKADEALFKKKQAAENAIPLPAKATK